MGSKYARGDKAVGICQRCSRKLLRRHMDEDGYYPSLIVCDECRDERHPQERLPKLDDPTTIYKPAPDDVGIPPVLTVENLGINNGLRVSWTEAEPINARIETYVLYARNVTLGEEFAVIATLPITYDIFMAITDQDLSFDHEGLESGTVYEYFVAAVTANDGPDTLTSNRAQGVTETVDTDYLLCENLDPIMTEDYDGAAVDDEHILWLGVL